MSLHLLNNSISEALTALPHDAKEPVVDQLFSGKLLEELGFETNEIYPQYQTGNGQRAVDKAARKNISSDDLFISTKTDPYLLVELKGRDINLCEGSAQYHATVRQLKCYMLDPNCRSVKWGLITNSLHIQLFRKHGKTVHPASRCIALDAENIEVEIKKIREKIQSQEAALTIAVYNNKGGVGKTTTTVNLAATLAFLGKRVLAVDFDPNQQDLSSSLGILLSKDKVYDALTQKDKDLLSTLETYKFQARKNSREFSFDVIPADQKLSGEDDSSLRQRIKLDCLYRKLKRAREMYDYILIDSPPNWRIFSQVAIYAADVVLIPTKHNNLFSLENAATAIKKFIPTIQESKVDGTPVALPVFFNGEKITPPQLSAAQKEINSIIHSAKQEGFNLLPYFYPKYTNAQRNLHIYQVPGYANIASAAFARVPAVYRDRAAHDYYKNLAKEYFLQ